MSEKHIHLNVGDQEYSDDGLVEITCSVTDSAGVPAEGVYVEIGCGDGVSQGYITDESGEIHVKAAAIATNTTISAVLEDGTASAQNIRGRGYASLGREHVGGLSGYESPAHENDGEVDHFVDKDEFFDAQPYKPAKPVEEHEEQQVSRARKAFKMPHVSIPKPSIPRPSFPNISMPHISFPGKLKWVALLSALSVTAGLGKKVYDDSKALAHDIAVDTRSIPMLPVVTEDGETLTYISSKFLVDNRVQNWEESSNITDPHDIVAESDWRLKPIYVEDVLPGGDLYLTRQALVAVEDKSFEDNIGIDLKGIARAVVKGKGGASTIHDQLCGSVFDLNGRYRSAGTYGKFDPLKYKRKLEEMSCGVGLGLGGQMEADEVMANYLTFVRLGTGTVGVRNFADRYWGINDLKELTEGQKIILAALPKYPVGSRVRGYEKNKGLGKEEAFDLYLENDLKRRAHHILGKLIEAGIVDKLDEERIKREIDGSELPMYKDTHSEYYRAQKEYRFIERLANKELQEMEGVHDFGEEPDARSNVKKIVVKINNKIQGELDDIMGRQLKRMPSFVRGTTFIVNQDGEYLALHTGGVNGFDDQSLKLIRRRLSEEQKAASLTKSFVAAGIANKGYMPDDKDQKVGDAWVSLSKSVSALEGAAKDLGVDKFFVKDLIKCYGYFEPDSDMSWEADPIHAAVTGNVDIKPAEVSKFMYAILTGEALRQPHLITGLETNARFFNVSNFAALSGGSVKDKKCASLIYQGGLTKKWMEAPLKGTMKKIHVPTNATEFIGKTGSANADEDGDGNAEKRTTNLVWAPFAMHLKDGGYVMSVTYLRSERIDEEGAGRSVDNRTSFSANGTSVDFAVPVARDVVSSIGDNL